jgi:hypothetical protein
MVFRKYGIFMVGLGMLAGSARATITYSASQAAFGTQATVTDGLTLSSLITFTAANLTTINGVACGCSDDEYIDPTTGLEFLAFNGSGTTNEAFASVTAGVLYTAANSGDSIEVIFPTGLDDGFAFNFTTTRNTGDTLCVGTSVGGCNGSNFAGQFGSAFIGALNDNPTLAPLTVVWLTTPGSADTDLQSFEVATQAPVPEGPTNLLLGSGLSALYWLYRRRRHQPLPA